MPKENLTSVVFAGPWSIRVRHDIHVRGTKCLTKLHPLPFWLAMHLTLAMTRALESMSVDALSRKRRVQHCRGVATPHPYPVAGACGP